MESCQGRGAKIALLDSGIDTGHPDNRQDRGAEKLFTGGNRSRRPFGARHQRGEHSRRAHRQRQGCGRGCRRCKLLVAQVMDSSGGVEAANLIPALDWSVDNGADVINLSFGGSDGEAGNEILGAKIRNAYARGKGAVVFAAAGNERKNTKHYPAAYRTVIAVSATTSTNNLASISSRGWVESGGAGNDILSTSAGGGYNEESGTSASATFVSALAGLLASEGKTAGRDPQPHAVHRHRPRTRRRRPVLRARQDRREQGRSLIAKGLKSPSQASGRSDQPSALVPG